MIREFSSKGHGPKAESHYQDWIEQHRTNGFVFNLFGGTNAKYNIIHRCSCRTLHRDKDEGARTNFPKLCSTELDELEDAATNKLGNNALWRHCKICKPDEDTDGNDA